MHRRDTDRIPLYQRIRDTPTRQHVPRAGPDTPVIRHCWVTDEHGRLPGLLLEWRQTAAGWQGRIVRPVLDGGAWLVVEEWLPSDRLEPAS